MKSPVELSAKLAKQWQHADNREQRLLSADTWPLSLSIGKPDAKTFTANPQRVREHVHHWREVKIGEVVWEPVRFQSASESVRMPLQWVLHSASDWALATQQSDIQKEYERLRRLLLATDPQFHRLLIRQRYLLQEKTETEIIQATHTALALSCGYAKGRPLRALAVAGIDSKFLERHRGLMIQLLDIRFDGQASDLGLEPFLDALNENDHWLLLVPLDTALLPFSQQRVRSSELAATELTASHILVVENEQCLHQLPSLPDTIAILGTGLNLSWMQASWLGKKRIGYWGDMDTWGLHMLATARSFQTHVDALLMNLAVFDTYSEKFAVIEASRCDRQPRQYLSTDEESFYQHLLALDKGRIEQEFLPTDEVRRTLMDWRNTD